MVLCSGYFDTPETHLSLRLNRCDIRNSIHLHGCLASRTLVGHASTCHRRTDRRRIYPFDCLCLPAWICTTSRNTTNALRPSSELKMKARYFPLGSGYENTLDLSCYKVHSVICTCESDYFGGGYWDRAVEVNTPPSMPQGSPRSKPSASI